MKNSWLFVLVAALVLVAGCAAPKAPAAVPGPAPGEAPGDAMEDKSGDAMMESGSVAFASVPSEVLIGKPIEVSWTVSGKGAVETAVLHGTKSSSASEPAANAYQSYAPRVMLKGEAGDYMTTIVYGDPITVYVRAYATVGGKAVWSEEKMVKIVTKLSTVMVKDDAAMSDS